MWFVIRKANGLPAGFWIKIALTFNKLGKVPRRSLLHGIRGNKIIVARITIIGRQAININAIFRIHEIVSIFSSHGKSFINTITWERANAEEVWICLSIEIEENSAVFCLHHYSTVHAVASCIFGAQLWSYRYGRDDSTHLIVSFFFFSTHNNIPSIFSFIPAHQTHTVRNLAPPSLHVTWKLVADTSPDPILVGI